MINGKLASDYVTRSDLFDVLYTAIRLSKLKDKEYRVHRQTGKTTRANIKDENYHDIVKRMTIKVKSGLILPIDAKVIIEKNRTRKIRTDKLEILHHLSLQDKSLYLMKNR